MPKATVSAASKTKASVSKARPREGLAKSVEERLSKLYQSLHDSLSASDAAKALKTAHKILRLAPEEQLARSTRIQLLITLERYRDALTILGGGELPEHPDRIPAAKRIKVKASDPAPKGDSAHSPNETAYCLYKLGKLNEARAVIEDVKAAAMDPEATDRALLLLEAQILYRLEEYEVSRAAYEILLVTVEPDSPEQADIENNIAACTVHLDFFASIPSRLAELRPDVAALESTPLVTVVPQPARRPTAASAPAPVKKQATKPKKAPKLPPAIAAMPEADRPAPDPERWLPKTERSGWAEEKARLDREKASKRDKKKSRQAAALATQGSTSMQQGSSKSNKKKKR